MRVSLINFGGSEWEHLGIVGVFGLLLAIYVDSWVLSGTWCSFLNPICTIKMMLMVLRPIIGHVKYVEPWMSILACFTNFQIFFLSLWNLRQWNSWNVIHNLMFWMNIANIFTSILDNFLEFSTSLFIKFLFN